MSKVRLDRLLAERGLVESRARAEALILAGRVEVDGVRAEKPGTPVSETADLRVESPPYPWVSRGGVKLDAALTVFGIDPPSRVCLDVGASTGGFTDVLLSRGAQRVYAVDVGYGQLHARLRSDPRVVLRERVNARFLSAEHVPEPVSLAVVDVSFISLALILPSVLPLLEEGAAVVVLIKPQFESHRGEVGKGGIVRDEKVRLRAIERVRRAAFELGFSGFRAIESALPGAEGNIEYVATFNAPKVHSGREPKEE